MFAEIIIPIALPKNYTWSIPESLQEEIMVGMRVEVILGANKRYAGIVKKIIHQKDIGFKTKAILGILDEAPIVYPAQLSLWEWMAKYYLCTEGEVMQAAIPSHLKISSESVFILNEQYTKVDVDQLSDAEYIIREALEIKKVLNLGEIQKLLDRKSVYPVVNKLIQKGICLVQENMVDKYTIKEEIIIQLNPKYKKEENLEPLLNEWTRAPKQLQLLLAYLHLLKTEGTVLQKDLLQKANANHAQLKGLIEKGILVAEKRKVERVNSQHIASDDTIQLSDAQKTSLTSLREQMQSHGTILLHGITGSGKTQLYVSIINDIIASGKQALYMLPEIALTAQMIRRLKMYFGNNIAIYHSKFNPNERVEIWNKVKQRQCNVVIGPRSSLFLPFSDLGLIIVDEEHEQTYKQQEPAPRFNARDSAIVLANQSNCTDVLTHCNAVALGCCTVQCIAVIHACHQRGSADFV
jgi:primosomal protein N' (replication factor Y)